ncbi:MAG TPA: type III pantothenate kinase [Candidatus Limnocylindrales bacterium]|nr:type III pantothenate kinase [Candidatus Limnocylindrales bacterium]
MLIAINIGNTNITGGIFDGSKILEMWKISKNEHEELEKKILKFSKIDGVIIASVVPQITPIIKSLIKKLNLPIPIVVNSKLKLPIRISVDNPDKVGADLIANIVAAYDQYKKPVIVLDSGTATTFCLLSQEGEFTGAVIAGGLQSMSKTLSESTALLPKVEIEKPEKIIGKNTVDSMRSGIYYGYIGLVNEILKRIKKEYIDAFIIGTGGNILNVIDELPLVDEYNQSLTLEGLRIIHELNSS